MILTNPYFYTTLFGLAVKIWATHRLFKTRSKYKIPLVFFTLFLLACFAQSLFEIGIYSIVGQSEKDVIDIVLQGYYFATFGILATLPLAMAELIYRSVNVCLIIFNTLLFLSLSYLLISTHLLIVDYESLKYSFTRVPGDYYYVFQVYVVLVFSICVSMLGINARLSSGVQKIKASNLLIGFIPFALAVIIVMILMRLGLSINMVGPVPFLISIFIITISKNMEEDIIDYRIYLPWTKEAKLIKRVSEHFSRVSYRHEAYKDNPKYYEQMLIQHIVDILGNRKEAAQWLGISESKISRALRKRQ